MIGLRDKFNKGMYFVMKVMKNENKKQQQKKILNLSKGRDLKGIKVESSL